MHCNWPSLTRPAAVGLWKVLFYNKSFISSPTTKMLWLVAKRRNPYSQAALTIRWECRPLHVGDVVEAVHCALAATVVTSINVLYGKGKSFSTAAVPRLSVIQIFPIFSTKHMILKNQHLITSHSCWREKSVIWVISSTVPNADGFHLIFKENVLRHL